MEPLVCLDKNSWSFVTNHLSSRAVNHVSNIQSSPPSLNIRVRTVQYIQVYTVVASLRILYAISIFPYCPFAACPSPRKDHRHPFLFLAEKSNHRPALFLCFLTEEEFFVLAFAVSLFCLTRKSKLYSRFFDLYII